jgi:hypothetical protein
LSASLLLLTGKYSLQYFNPQGGMYYEKMDDLSGGALAFADRLPAGSGQ